MELRIKSFDGLSCRELYEILRLRSQVFIVEQQGCYQDPDGIDYDSVHIYIEDRGELLGCIRVFAKKDEEGTCQLGRLVVRDRLRGLGSRLMAAAEETAKQRFGASRVFLTGRRSAREFYEKCGYSRQVPAAYREADAPYYLFRKDL